MRQARFYPDMIIGAVGGGSAFGGLILPFYRDGNKGTQMVVVETESAPSLSQGTYKYDYADSAGMSVLFKMYTLGPRFNPPGIRAGGMRYHGISPIISALYREGDINKAVTHTQTKAFRAAVAFARAEGIVPSAESSYTLAEVMDEALKCREIGEQKNILFVVTANGNFDVGAYRDFLAGSLADHQFPAERVAAALKDTPEQHEQDGV